MASRSPVRARTEGLSRRFVPTKHFNPFIFLSRTQEPARRRYPRAPKTPVVFFFFRLDVLTSVQTPKNRRSNYTRLLSREYAPVCVVCCSCEGCRRTPLPRATLELARPRQAPTGRSTRCRGTRRSWCATSLWSTASCSDSRSRRQRACVLRSDDAAATPAPAGPAALLQLEVTRDDGKSYAPLPSRGSAAVAATAAALPLHPHTCRAPGCAAPLAAPHNEATRCGCERAAPAYLGTELFCNPRLCDIHATASSLALPGFDAPQRLCQGCLTTHAVASFASDKRSCEARPDCGTPSARFPPHAPRPGGASAAPRRVPFRRAATGAPPAAAWAAVPRANARRPTTRARFLLRRAAVPVGRSWRAHAGCGAALRVAEAVRRAPG